MIAALAALILVQAAAPAEDLAFDTRMRDSAAAAQALQGPLDGRWVLNDRRGRALYDFQINDPPHNSRPLQGAWSAAAGGEPGVLTAVTRSGNHLTLSFNQEPQSAPVQLSLTRSGRDLWRGRMTRQGVTHEVRLSRKTDAAFTASKVRSEP